MYSVSKKSKRKRRKKFHISVDEVLNLDGFIMSTSRKSFSINGVSVVDLKIVNRMLARPLVTKCVFSKFNKLINSFIKK